jgi:ApaG protein
MNLTNHPQTKSPVEVHITSFYLPKQSAPEESRFAFGYTIKIRNKSKKSLQLLRRHWLITDANENTQELNGKGVVGEQPLLEPNQTFEYTSGSIIETAVGCMQGSYKMVTDDGHEFEVVIPPFCLSKPQSLH